MESVLESDISEMAQLEPSVVTPEEEDEEKDKKKFMALVLTCCALLGMIALLGGIYGVTNVFVDNEEVDGESGKETESGPKYSSTDGTAKATPPTTTSSRAVATTLVLVTTPPTVPTTPQATISAKSSLSTPRPTRTTPMATAAAETTPLSIVVTPASEPATTPATTTTPTKPTTPKPTTPRPTTPKPTTAKPTTPKPTTLTTPKPTTPKPTTPKPTTPKPTTPKPTTPKPTTAKPTTAKPTTAKPTTPKPTTPKPTTPKPTTPKPTTPKPTTPKPTTPKPTTPKPTTPTTTTPTTTTPTTTTPKQTTPTTTTPTTTTPTTTTPTPSTPAAVTTSKRPVVCTVSYLASGLALPLTGECDIIYYDSLLLRPEDTFMGTFTNAYLKPIFEAAKESRVTHNTEFGMSVHAPAINDFSTEVKSDAGKKHYRDHWQHKIYHWGVLNIHEIIMKSNPDILKTSLTVLKELKDIAKAAGENTSMVVGLFCRANGGCDKVSEYLKTIYLPDGIVVLGHMSYRDNNITDCTILPPSCYEEPYAKYKNLSYMHSVNALLDHTVSIYSRSRLNYKLISNVEPAEIQHEKHKLEITG